MDKGTAMGAAALVIAAAVGAGTLLRSDEPGPGGANPSLAALLERVDSLDRRVAAIEGRPTASGSVGGNEIDEALSEPEPVAARLNAATSASQLPERQDEGVSPATTETAPAGSTTTQLLTAVDRRVDRAVEKKVAEVEADRKLKQNKKPSLDAFAEALELDSTQRRVVDEQIREGQRQIREILETPTAEGANLLEELVDAMAHGAAKRPETGPLFSKWYGRLVSLTVPGTAETYAAKMETVKGAVRDGLRRDLSDEQYAEFEEWGLDPTEIQEITNTPWADFDRLVADRQAALVAPR
jgi:hypothetical protein